MYRNSIFIATCLTAAIVFAGSNETAVNNSKLSGDKSGEEHIGKVITDGHKGPGGAILLKDKETLATMAMFKPPVEITIVAKTDSTDLRLSYAADEVIFNYFKRPGELLVQGGPARKQILQGRGQIPENKFVTIKWTVMPNRQEISVDGGLRFEHDGNYSKINLPLAVFTTGKAKVTVKSIKVRDLSEASGNN